MSLSNYSDVPLIIAQNGICRYSLKMQNNASPTRKRDIEKVGNSTGKMSMAK